MNKVDVFKNGAKLNKYLIKLPQKRNFNILKRKKNTKCYESKLNNDKLIEESIPFHQFM